jgi:hypothetical protein
MLVAGDRQAQAARFGYTSTMRNTPAAHGIHRHTPTAPAVPNRLGRRKKMAERAEGSPQRLGIAGLLEIVASDTLVSLEQQSRRPGLFEADNVRIRRRRELARASYDIHTRAPS